jgi:hypothetical protein
MAKSLPGVPANFNSKQEEPQGAAVPAAAAAASYGWQRELR